MIMALKMMSNLTKSAFCQSIIMTVTIISVPLHKTLRDMKKIPIFAFTMLCFCFCSCSNSDSKQDVELKNDNILITDESFVVEDTTITLYPDDFTFNPKKGMVPDKETAARIAEAIWLPIYGEEMIYKERPYQANLINDSIWIVWGSFEQPQDTNCIFHGGAAFIEISKKDGRIMQLLHEE